MTSSLSLSLAFTLSFSLFVCPIAIFNRFQKPVNRTSAPSRFPTARVCFLYTFVGDEIPFPTYVRTYVHTRHH